jgi:hypothetical protein
MTIMIMQTANVRTAAGDAGVLELLAWDFMPSSCAGEGDSALARNGIADYDFAEVVRPERKGE